VIQVTGNLLKQACNLQIDFVGHIGGDDFIVLFLSEDWEQRCQEVLRSFGEIAPALYKPEDRELGGIEIENRRGKRAFHPILSLSVGAVMIATDQCHSYHEVSALAAVAKKQAKKMSGNSLFVERRALEPNPLLAETVGADC
jgi:GGDEF domain-containing protein